MDLEKFSKWIKQMKQKDCYVCPPFYNFAIQSCFLGHIFIAETEKVSVVQTWKNEHVTRSVPQFPRKYAIKKETADPEGSDELSMSWSLTILFF